MKILSLALVLSACGAVSGVLLPMADAVGQTTVSTNPVGYLQVSCLSNSDTLVAPPFTRPAAFVGAVSSISGNVLTLANASLTADQFDAPATTPPTKDTYYLSIGPATATLTGTLAVTSGSTAVTGTGTTFGTDVKAGDRLTINDGYNLLTYTVAAIGSPTSLTLDRAYADSAATGTTSAVSASKASSTQTTTVKTGTIKPTTTTINTTAAASSLSGLSATYDHSPYEGRFYQVAANGTNSVTVILNGDTLSSVAAGTQVSIIPYWTLNSVFNTTASNPTAGEYVSFTPTTSTHSLQTKILIPNYAGVGINISSAVTYFFYDTGTASSTGWRLTTDYVTDQGNVPLQPDGYFTVRTPTNDATLPVTFSGAVPTNKQVTMLATSATQPQDNAVALNRPADGTLNSLGLNATDGSFNTTTSSHQLQDKLLVFSNSTAVINKSSSATYIYYNDGTNIGWRLSTDLTTDHGTDPIPAGSALIIRKVANTSGQTVAWTNSPNY